LYLENKEKKFKKCHLYPQQSFQTQVLPQFFNIIFINSLFKSKILKQIKNKKLQNYKNLNFYQNLSKQLGISITIRDFGKKKKKKNYGSELCKNGRNEGA
jgi:hypothetical protein